MTHAQIAADARQPYADKLLAMHGVMADFMRYLQAPKFAGSCPLDGSRKDWIAVNEVIAFIRDVQAAK